MPELPEVETTCQGISPHIKNQIIKKTIVRQAKLRWPIPSNLAHTLKRNKIIDINRRGKYLLLHMQNGTLIIHLGMSGRLCVLPENAPAQKHDHFDLVLENNLLLRLTDPRRFGAVLWTSEPAAKHKLLIHLGVEPLLSTFNQRYLFSKLARKNIPIKTAIMDAHIVVGVGNIYANEALFLCNIHPLQRASTLSSKQCQMLVSTIKKVLRKAIKAGGTTLKDFRNSDGKPGYFSQHLYVYGRADEPCLHCGTTLTEVRLNNRSTVFCPSCQPKASSTSG